MLEVVDTVKALYKVITMCRWFKFHEHGDNLPMGGEHGIYNANMSENKGGKDERIEFIFAKGKANTLPSGMIGEAEEDNEDSDDPTPPIEPMD